MKTLVTQNYIRAYTLYQNDCSNIKAIEIPSTNDEKGDHVWSTNFTIVGNTFENFYLDPDHICNNNRVLTVPLSSFEGSDIATFGANTMVTYDNSSAFVFPVEDIYSNSDCGGWACTGLSNLLVKDSSGTLFGKISTLLPLNNSLVSDDGTCELNNIDRGYICPNENWALLAFESLDGDKYSRSISPITVRSSSGATNKLNTLKICIQTLNSHGIHNNGVRRLSRFSSLLQTNKSYTIEYYTNLPKKLHFQLQGANPYDWVIIKQGYTTNQIIKANVNGITGQSIVNINNASISSSDSCGSYIYNSLEQSITFKLTGAADCDVVIKLTDSVKGRVRYALNIEEFFQKNGPTLFANEVAFVLGIDLSRVRVVEVVRGSVIVEFYIYSLETNTTGTNLDGDIGSQTPTASPQEYSNLAELNTIAAKLQDELKSGSRLNNLFNSSILDSNVTVVFDKNYYPDLGTIGASKPDEDALFLGLLIGGSAFGGLVLIALILSIRNRNKGLKSNIAKIAPISSKQENKIVLTNPKTTRQSQHQDFEKGNSFDIVGQKTLHQDEESNILHKNQTLEKDDFKDLKPGIKQEDDEDLDQVFQNLKEKHGNPKEKLEYNEENSKNFENLSPTRTSILNSKRKINRLESCTSESQLNFDTENKIDLMKSKTKSKYF